jgi:hypothetical protein
MPVEDCVNGGESFTVEEDLGSRTYWEMREGKVVCAWCHFEPSDFSHHKCRVYLNGSTPDAELRAYLRERNAERNYWQQLEDSQRAVSPDI